MADPPPVPDPTSLTTDALHREIGKLREEIRGNLSCERELRQEAVTALTNHVAQIELRRVESKADAATALDAALTSQRDAADKDSRSLEKQLGEIKTNVGTIVESLRREIGDLKERVGAVEQQKVGATQVERRHTASLGQVIAAVGAGVGVLGVLITAVVVLANVLTGT